MTLLGYRLALAPTPAQARALSAHAGAARMVFNWALARVKATLDQRAAERSYGIAVGDLTPSLNWTLAGLRRDWNAAKDVVAPWWPECSKEAFNTGLDALARALKGWSESKKGIRKGPPVGFPRFRSRRRTPQKIRFTTGAMRCESSHAVLPRIGRVKISEHGPRGGLAGRLTRSVAAGSARVVSVGVRFEQGRWFAAFTVEHTHQGDQDGLMRPGPVHPDAVVGIDLGVAHLATLSTGQVISNPRHQAVATKKVRRLARRVARRQGPDRRTRTEPSKRWARAAGDLARAQGKVAHARRDGLHQLTAALSARYGTLVVEDLNVAGMTRSARGSAAVPGKNVAAKAGLNRAVADAAFGEFRRQLEYKAAWRGGRVIVAQRWFPSSKTCSGCGAVTAKLSLSERRYRCGSCGVVLDRDLNAARNLAALAQDASVSSQHDQHDQQEQVAASGAETVNGRGADRQTVCARQVAVKRQPGTSRPRAAAGQTGTLILQRVSAGEGP